MQDCRNVERVQSKPILLLNKALIPFVNQKKAQIVLIFHLQLFSLQKH